MAVRNFYVDCKIDGRSTTLTGGPQNKEGGMRLVITQRNNKGIVKAITVECYAYDGDLQTIVYDSNGDAVYKYESER